MTADGFAGSLIFGSMKPMLIALLLTISTICSAQKILIPYRDGRQFGLSDDKGKIVTNPQFDHLSWMEDTWFKTGKKIELKDTLETSPGRFFIRNTKIELTGLINNGKIILQNEPFDDYEIVARKCIVTRYEGRPEDLTKEQFKKYGSHRRLYSLFNLQGKNLYPANFKRIQKIDTTGISNKDKRSARYILFLTVDLNDRNSMFVFDTDEQQISDWLVKEAIKIEGDRKMIASKQIAFSIVESSYRQSNKILDYNSGRFTLTDRPPVPAITKSKNEGEKVELTTESGPGSYDVAVPPMEGDPVRKKPAFNPYHILIKDTLYYLTSYQDKHPVTLPAGGKIILLEPKGMTQYHPVIAKANDQFYIIQKDAAGAIAYDSLIYFGKYFLAWKKINGQIRAGVIDANDSIVVPMEYDSLYADIKYFNLKNRNPAGKSDYGIELGEADSKYDYNKTNPYKRTYSYFLTVFKNGKCGVINMKSEIVVPMEYELIAKNNLQHSRPREDAFIIIKQNKKYGLATFKYNKGQKSPAFVMIAAPGFDYIPGFFYPNYYGVKDFKLIGLYNEQMEFKGYALENGKVFYRE